VVTDENHHLLDCVVPTGRDLVELSRSIKATVDVVEHGFFVGMADEAILGTPEGGVERLSRQVGGRTAVGVRRRSHGGA
jgi:ribose 5-phosphate isomerase A